MRRVPGIADLGNEGFTAQLWITKLNIEAKGPSFIKDKILIYKPKFNLWFISREFVILWVIFSKFQGSIS